MRDAVICEPLRTPVGCFGGVFKDLSANQLAETVVRELVSRSQIAPTIVEDLILGQCTPSGETPAIGRIVALDAGLGVQVPGTQVDRRCGSGLQAVIDACMRVMAGGADLLIAGGAEAMSQAEHYVMGARWGLKGDSNEFRDRLARARITAGGRDHQMAGGMIETAENLRREFGISREAQDIYALESQRRAKAAQDAGLFADEIVPVTVRQRRETVSIAVDEHPRPQTTMADLQKLRAIRGGIDAEATVTAGNASGQNDGAAACIVTTREMAEKLGLKPLARLAGWSVTGLEPERMGLGPVASTERALQRAGITMTDLDLMEINEAFAVQVLACAEAMGLGQDDFARLNVNGSGISLGHPLGATGARILATLLREMDRREARYGLETMCIGGGQGLAAIFERVV